MMLGGLTHIQAQMDVMKIMDVIHQNIPPSFAHSLSSTIRLQDKCFKVGAAGV